ncbi:MAG: glycosyl hydrolase 53 family protein [Saprospiraceae bacterium]|nr:glycosyl hydrolase 53 family protein [Saprospiraceae bacterium]
MLLKRLSVFPALATILLLCQCQSSKQPPSTDHSATDFSHISQVDSGNAVSVMLTCYSTTLRANGTDQTRVRLAVVDSISRQITSSDDTIHLYITGTARITDPEGATLKMATDTAGITYLIAPLQDGVRNLTLHAGTETGKVQVEARAPGLWAGSHEIHLIPADFRMMHPSTYQLPVTTKPIDRMIGADISFLPQIEARGGKFYEDGTEKDGMLLLRDHGFNFIRLRIFVNPEHENGYAPGTGFCGLPYTLAMARRIRDAGMQLLLDFHYSDYWADPQQQYKPAAWTGLDFPNLKDSVRAYTSRVLTALQGQNTPPAMVQIGNEINHGILWPDGHIGNPDQLAELLMAGAAGVRAVDPEIPVMMHIALGGQNAESVFWLDNMLARGVEFDIIGLSYYPRWHGTLSDLDANMRDLIRRYNKPINLVEYSDFKHAVHDIVFGLPGDRGKGTCIWEPLGRRSRMFDQDGNVNGLINVYGDLARAYLE